MVDTFQELRVRVNRILNQLPDVELANSIHAAHRELTLWLPVIKRGKRKLAEERLRDLERQARELVDKP